VIKEQAFLYKTVNGVSDVVHSLNNDINITKSNLCVLEIYSLYRNPKTVMCKRTRRFLKFVIYTIVLQ
jgi:hypothetical protein